MIVREDSSKFIYYLLEEAPVEDALEGDVWEGEAAAVEASEMGVTVGRISLASNSTRSNSKSKFPVLPLLVITTVCQLLSMALD